MPKPGFERHTPSEEMQHFTDREDQQSVFRRYLSSTLEPPVLCFYGIGGAGKTWLLKKLMGIIPSGIPTAFLDFDRERGGRTFTIDPSSGLQEIRRQLGVGCARFDVAYNVMLFKQGVRDDKNVLLEVASEITATEGANAIAGAASDVIELAASTAFALHSLPGVPVLLKHLSKPLLEKIKGTSFEAMLCRTEVQKLALELRSKTAQQIGDELVEYLAQDLRENLPTHLNRAVSAVIFFDTFEGIGTELLNEQHRRQSEAWVRSVASAFNFALVVIGGQNRISWENIDPDWSTHLDQHLVGGLSESDARQFLSKCAISGAELQNAILATSKEADGGFHCFSLGLCADVVYHDRKNGIATSPESLRLPPRDWKRLADRFLKSLGSDHRARWISRLAITPRFDEAAAKAAFSEQRMIEQDTAWDELRGYSFVERSVDQPAWFSIRYQMRRALELQPANEERVMSDHAWWHQLWKARSTSATDQEASLAWYHQYFLSPAEAVEAWKTLAESARSEVPVRMREHLRLLAWWQPLGLNSAGPLSQEKAYELSVLAAELQEASLGDRGANLRQTIAYYEAALRVRTEQDFPQDWAATQNNLGIAWGNLPTGDRGSNLRQAIVCYEAALRVYTEQDFPQNWAMTQNNLGIAWWDLPTGDRGSNLRQAIVCYEAALRVYTEQDFPQDRAMTQNNLGNAWGDLPTGDRGANLRQAIVYYEAALRVYTERDFPQDWATTQNNLGIAWGDLPTGDRGANLRQAIVYYEAALRVRTEQDFPQAWAATQNNLGNAWGDLPAGDRGSNLRQAIVYYEAALRVYTEQDFPQAWAATQNNLGTAWGDLPTGDRGANLRQAIACYEAALRVYTERDFPQDWAMTQNNLGIAWRNLPTGDRGSNLRQAIACYEAALRVYTERDFPQDWATTQNNLGIAWRNLPTGDRGANLRQAIACYEAALRVYTERDFPQDWAMTQNNLGTAWGNLPTGDRGANLRQAIVYYEAALRVYTEQDFPQDWAMTQNNLALSRSILEALSTEQDKE